MGFVVAAACDAALAIELLPTTVWGYTHSFKERKEAKRAYKEAHKSNKEIAKANDKEVEETVSKAKETYDIVPRDVQSTIMASDTMYIEKAVLLSRASKATKLIDFVVYYVSHIDAKELLGLDKEEKEFCNAIAEKLGYIKIYPDADIAELQFYDIDSASFSQNPKFVISMTSILGYLTDNFVAKVNAKKEKLNIVTEPLQGSGDGLNGGIFPFHFSRPNANNTLTFGDNGSVFSTDVQGNLPDEMFNACEKYIKPLFDNAGIQYNYTYNPDGSITLKTLRYGVYKEFTIDPGSTYGKNAYAVVARDLKSMNGFDTTSELIPLQETELIHKYLVNEFEDPTSEEVVAITSKYTLPHYQLNMMFDMSTIDFSNWSEDVVLKFDEALCKVYAVLMLNFSNTVTVLPRFRFTSFEGYNKFSFVSDENVRIFLHDIGGHNGTILPGCSGSLDGNTFVFTSNHQEAKYDLNEVVKS